jgi:hypothetical protein
MYQACRRPGRKPRQQSAMLIKESAEQMPRLTLEESVSGGNFGHGGPYYRATYQTASGGNRMAMRPRKMSLPHIIANR